MTRTDCRDGRPEKMASNEKNTDNNCEVFDNWEDLDETDVIIIDILFVWYIFCVFFEASCYFFIVGYNVLLMTFYPFFRC